MKKAKRRYDDNSDYRPRKRERENLRTRRSIRKARIAEKGKL